MVTTFYPPYHFGGDAVMIRRLAHALIRRGHSVDVIHDVDSFSMLHRGATPAPLVEPPNLRTHPLRSRFGALSCLATQQTGRPIFHGRRIRRILDEGRFDVIHYHNISLVGGPGVLAYGEGIKLYMAHEHWLVCPTHVLWRHNREVCTGRQCLRCQLRYRRPPQLWRYTGLLERMGRHVDAFCSPSAFSAAKHREFGFPFEMEVLPNFLPDLDSGNELPVGDPADVSTEPYFLFVGRLEKIKGLQDVLPLFRGAAPTALWVVGTGTYEEELRQQAVNCRVRFLGTRSPEALRPLYENAIAVIVPSVGYETFGVVILEAFREKTPVIARAIGPFADLVQNSGGGMLFETPAQLECAMRQLAEDPELRRRLGASGYEALLARWTEGPVMAVYFDMIRRIASKRNNVQVLEALGGDSLPSDRSAQF